MKRNADYWAERFKLIEQAEHNRGAAAVSDIEKQYREAQRQLEAKLDAWYRRFADNNQVSMTEAKKMLAGRDLKEFKWDVHEYIRYGEENAINQTWVKELENASARVHISRLEAMKIQMQQQCEVLFGNQLDTIDHAMRDVYLDGFYRTAYEVQKGIGFGWDFGTLDQKRIDKIINKPWAADGRNFSDRVWSNKQKLVQELNTTLTQNIALGQDPQKAIDVMAKRLNVSKNTAGRLVMTEQAAFCSAAQHDCFKDLDVEEYEIVATLDSHTSEICQEMDGKHFKMSEWETGTTAPPFHVWCRSTTVPYFDDDFGVPGERAARGADGKTYYVPADTTYKEWSKAFVDGDKSGLQPAPEPDTVKDTPKTFKDKIQAVKDKIAANGGVVEESHLLEAGNAVAEEYKGKTDAMNHEYEEASAVYDGYITQIDDLNAEIDALMHPPVKEGEEFDPFTEIMRSSDLYEQHKAEIDALSKKKMDILDSDEFRAAEQRRNDAATAINKFTYENSAQWLKDKLSEIREMGSDGLDVSGHLMRSSSPMRKVVERAYSYYPKDWVQKSIQRGTLTPKKVNRGYYSDWGGVIAISGSGNSAFETAVHELGHRMERAIPGIRDSEKVFYDRRTQGETLEWLGTITGNTHYKKSEMSRKDKFISAYMGKDYGGSAYELVSMGFEYAYTQPATLAQDADMQAWIYGLLALY